MLRDDCRACLLALRAPENPSRRFTGVAAGGEAEGGGSLAAPEPKEPTELKEAAPVTGGFLAGGVPCPVAAAAADGGG